MNCCNTTKSGATTAFQRGFSLIELVGVLAVLAILAAVLAPALLKQTDKVVADRETATLQSFGDAIQRSILRTRGIPSDSNWTNIVAIELGMNVSDVATNPRGQRRAFLIDTNGFSPLSLPYSQGYSGAIANPPSPRLMIVSSLGAGLPSAVPNTPRPSTTDFNALWSAAPGTVSGSLWTGWGGKPADVVIQRINLSTLFVGLSLGSNQSPSRCYYSIDSQLNPNPVALPVTNYFLVNSVLGLFNGTTNNLESQVILNANTSLFFYRNVWCSQWAPATNSFTGFTDNTFSLWQNLSAISSGFYYAPAYPTATVSQAELLQDFMDYFDAYQAWADAADAAAGSNDPTDPKYWPKDDKKAPYKTVLDLYNATKVDIEAFVKAFAP